MKIQFQNVSTKSTQELETLAEQKLESLSLKYNFINEVNVYFKNEYSFKGDSKICEIKLKTEKAEFLVLTSEDCFKKAIKNSMVLLEHQLITSSYHAVA